MFLLLRWMIYTMILMAAIPAFADETVMLKSGFMSLDARGSFGAAAGGLAATPISVDSTVKFSRSNRETVEIALQTGDFRAALNYFPLNFGGDGTLTSSLAFNGQTFSAGDKVHAHLEADVFDASLTYFLLNMDDIPTRIQFGMEVAVKTIHIASTLQNRTTGLTQSISTTLPIPTLGARGRVAFSDMLGLTGRAGYLGYAGNHFLDTEVQLEFSPLPGMGIYAGYRLIDLKLDSSGVLLDSAISGPFIGGFGRF
ncbi:MAG: hypothetical protein R8K53_04915 [Mariprofundaceae bacterium]